MTSEECRYGRAVVEFQRAKGHGEDRIRYLESHQVKEIEPNASADIMGAMYIPEPGSVNCRRMVKSMGLLAKGAGVQIHLNKEIQSIIYNNGHYKVSTKSTIDNESITYVSKTIIFATGAQSSTLVR